MKTKLSKNNDVVPAHFRDDAFRKSSHSGKFDGNTDCVEVAMAANAIGVRDSKHPRGAVLQFTPGEWNAFVKGVKAGEFDLK